MLHNISRRLPTLLFGASLAVATLSPARAAQATPSVTPITLPAIGFADIDGDGEIEVLVFVSGTLPKSIDRDGDTDLDIVYIYVPAPS